MKSFSQLATEANFPLVESKEINIPGYAASLAADTKELFDYVRLASRTASGSREKQLDDLTGHLSTMAKEAKIVNEKAKKLGTASYFKESMQLDEGSSGLTTKSTNLRKQIELFLRDVSAEQKTVNSPNEKRVYTEIGTMVSHMLAKLQEIDNKIHMDL